MIGNTQTIINSDSVYGIWYKTNSPYFVNNDIIIPLDSTLSIEAGVKIFFTDSAVFTVNGSLTAIGKSNDSIIFSIYDTTDFSNKYTRNGGWGGLRFYNPDIRSVAIFNYCKFTYGKALSTNDTLGNGGVIYVDSYPNIQFHNSDFTNNMSRLQGGAIFYTNMCNILIDSCLINNNISYHKGGGIATKHNATSLISNNKIIYNRCLNYNNTSFNGYSGGGVAIDISGLNHNHQPVLLNNYICNNESSHGGGVYESSTYTKIIGNIICNNSGYGIVNGHQLSRSRYINNTICYNGYSSGSMNYYKARGILSYALSIEVKNNIIRNNYAIGSYYNDSVSIDYPYPNATIKMHYIDYNNIEKGYDGDFNIDEEALFVNPTTIPGVSADAVSADWTLQDASTSINAGNNDTNYNQPYHDIYNNYRVYGNMIDLGAVENQNIVQSIENFGKSNSSIQLFPNPANEIIYLNIKNISDDLSFELLNIEGKKLQCGRLFQGNNQLIIGQLNKAMYFIHIFGKNYSETIKFIKN